MSRWIKIGVAVLFVLALLPVTPARAQTNPCVFTGVDENGALYYISLPFDFNTMQCISNGDLVIFAHGYVQADEPLAIPWDQMTLEGGLVRLPDLVNGLGYAFATTSYRQNGLAVKEGVLDILELIEIYTVLQGAPMHVYLVGASEGGLVTTLAIEKYPNSFSGGMAMCGPIGSFQGQVNYWGDFRVVFDYFMDTPTYDVLPGTAVTIPRALINHWDATYIPRIGLALQTNPLGTSQLLSVTRVPFVPENPQTIGETALGILWYNAFATRDATQELGGQPFDNRAQVYAGSLNDVALNEGVKRFKAKPEALAEIAANYETSGWLTRPLVTMHTRGDPIVPYTHLDLYKAKVGLNPLFVDYPVDYPLAPRYGHCSFTLTEILNGFSGLILMGSAFPVVP